MELRHLKTFQLAAKHLNFTKAAQQLNFSQPAVTAQIQALEQELKQQLFIRIGKKTFLTPAGELLKTYTDEIFATIDKLETAFSELLQPQGNVTIAAAESYCTNYFPYVIPEYLKHYPDVHIKLISHNSNEVIEGIESNKYDIGIIAGEVCKSGITNIVIAEEDMVLVIAKDLHALYPEDELLSHFPLLKYQASSHFESMMQKYLSQTKLPTKQVLEFSSLDTIKKSALNKVGVALLSSDFVKREIRNEELVPILVNHNSVKVKTSIIAREEKANLVTIRSLMDVIQSIWHTIPDIAQ